MQQLKKFNQFLLENYPILWYTKLPHLLISAVFTGVMSLVWGFAFASLHELKNGSFDEFIMSSFFVMFEVIFMIIIGVVWAIFFFKNNAFKNFYPISQFYLFKVLLLIFTGFLALLLSFGLFNTGAGLRANNFYTAQNFQADLDIMSQAKQFIPESQNSYNLDGNPFLRENNIEVSFIEKDSDTDEDYLNNRYNLFQKPDHVFRKYYKEADLDYYELKPSDYSLVDDKTCMFYSSETVYSNKDSCHSFDIMDKVYHFNHLSLDALSNYSLENHRPYYEVKSQKNNRSLKQMEKENLALIETKNYKGIQQQIENFSSVLDKYKVPQFVQPHLLIEYFRLKEMKYIRDVIGSDFIFADDKLGYMDEYDKSLFYYLEQLNNTQAKVDAADVTKFFNAMKSVKFYNYDANAWSQLEENYYEYNYYTITYVWISIFVAFGLAYLFLIFITIDVVSVLIAIPTSGVISLITSLIAIPIFAGMGGSSSESGVLLYVLFIEMILLGTILFLVYGNNGNRRVQQIALVIGYQIAPAIIMTVIGLVFFSESRSFSDSCGNYKFSDQPEAFHPLLILLYLLIASFMYLFVVRKAKSNPE